MPHRPEIVCLCGSMRFVVQMREAAARLTAEGVIVLAPGEIDLVTPAPVSPAQKDMLDTLHRHKIDLADRVLVVNPGGYIGASTRAEIRYAQTTGKPVSYTETE